MENIMPSAPVHDREEKKKFVKFFLALTFMAVGTTIFVFALKKTDNRPSATPSPEPGLSLPSDNTDEQFSLLDNPTASPGAKPSITPKPSPSATAKPTSTASPTASPSPTPVPTASPSPTPVPTDAPPAEPTPTPEPTAVAP